MAKLSERQIERLAVEPGRKDRMVFDDGCPGLGLRVTPQSKAFLVQWTDPATKRKVREPLGKWGALTLDQARDAARARLGKVALGINPRAEREAAAAEDGRRRAERALSLETLIERWAALHLATRRPSYRAEAERALRYAFEPLLKRPAARITRADVREVLDALVAAGKASIAGRTLAYGRAAYAWAGKREMVTVNPFAGLPISTAAIQRDRVLSAGELREVWDAAIELGEPFGPAIRLLMLTLARRDEVAGMRWPELEADGARWVIAAERTKNGKPHVIQMPGPARDVLGEVKRVDGRELLFSTTGKTPVSGWSKAKRAMDAAIAKARAKAAEGSGKDAEPMPGWTYHDFRRSGVSYLASVGFDPIVADKLLNHQPAALRGVAAVYQTYSFDAERAKALEAWAAHVVAHTRPSNVVPLVRPATA